MSMFVDIEKSLGSFFLKVKFEAGDETLALLGASGCGKSMTLKCVAGVEKPDRGRIVVDGVTLFDSEKKINLSPQERRVGFLFQNYALFPNMTVLQNIQAGAKREKKKEKREEAVERVLESFGLKELADRYPTQLSGGQQQRVALARILVSDPRVLLLDEPFSALDSHLRFRLEQEVREVIRSFGKTVLLVSHDRDEVFRMSDSIAVMSDGKVEACGEKSAVFADPRTKSGAMLTGCKNISRIEKRSETSVFAVDWGIELMVAEVSARSARPPNLAVKSQGMGQEANRGMIHYVGIRMHDICVGGGENTFRCQVVEEVENPFSYVIMLRPIGANASALIGWEMDKEAWSRMREGEVCISLPPESLLLLEE